MTLADQIAFLSGLPKFSDFLTSPRPAVPLRRTADFGSDPGNLRMWSFVPPKLDNAPLLVALHGCAHNAQAFDHGAGWSALAARYGFALLMPGQRQSNNPNVCFNWFERGDTSRGTGEVKSIRQMIAAMVRSHSIDTRRIFVVGLSAGGSMALSMLATYPEVFAGGAVIAGTPFGVASTVRDALREMAQPASRSRNELGQIVREASHHDGKWPTLSVWHGTADRTVHPANADAIVAQWLDVHGLPASPMSDVEGPVRRSLWWDDSGAPCVERVMIDGMTHGVPLRIDGAERDVGTAGSFMLNVGISAPEEIVRSFGLTDEAASSPRNRNIPHRPIRRMLSGSFGKGRSP